MKFFHISIILIVVVFLIHYLLINPIEKLLVYTATNDESIRRPGSECKGASNFGCLGMPSGHSESVVIVCLLLNKLKVLSIPACISIIAVVGLQRILVNRHTLLQVTTGWTVGYLYAYLYLFLWNKRSLYYVPAASLVIATLLSFALTAIIDTKITNDPVPSWVPDELKPIIEKKQNTAYYNKYMYSQLPIVIHNYVPYYSWKQLENMLDIVYEKVQKQAPKIDVVVGIKSGGAIVASYIHTKMPNTALYYVKCKRSKSEISFELAMEMADQVMNGTQDKISMEEGIAADIKNKNVLLIDELVHTGQSMVFVKKYLEEEKHVASVTLAAVNYDTSMMDAVKIINRNAKEIINENDVIYFSKTESAFIYPWGYDN